MKKRLALTGRGNDFHICSMRAAILMILLTGVLTLTAQNADPFGQAVKSSLLRSHLLFPDAATANSPLSDAILVQVDWLNRNDPTFFSDPDWPMKLAAAEALKLGIRARPVATPKAVDRSPRGKYLALVTKSFSVTGASFRKGQQIVLEQVQDYGKRAVTMVQGQPILIWLDNIKVLRAIGPDESAPALVKIRSARYGLAGVKVYNVSSEVQTLLTPNASGKNQVLVSDALLSPSSAQRLNRALVAGAGAAGQSTGFPLKVLSVTYEIDGVEKSKQALEGETLVLD